MGDKSESAGISAEFIAEQCLAGRLRLLTRAVTKLYSKELRPLGLTVSQMNILTAVSCHEGAKQRDYCRALHLDKSTLSRDVEKMRDLKWLDTLPDGDGRSSRLKLTGEGRKMLKKVIPAWHRAQRRAVALLGEKDIAVIHRAARTVRSSKTLAPA